MTRAKSGARPITVDGVRYRWRLSAHNAITRRHGPYEWRRGRLYVWPDRPSTRERPAGVAVTEVGFIPKTDDHPGFGIGPGLVRACVEQALAGGWQPDAPGEHHFDAGLWSFIKGAQTPTVDFAVAFEGAWRPVETLDPARVLTRWLARGAHPDALQGVLRVYADGERWAEDCESLEHSTHWLDNTRCLLAGDAIVDVITWSEASMLAVRRGEFVELFGTDFRGCVVWPLVQLPLRALARALADAAEAADAFYDALLRDHRLQRPDQHERRAALREALAMDWAQQVEALRLRLEATTPPRRPRRARDDEVSAGHVAIFTDQLHALRGAIAIEGVDRRFRGQTLLQNAASSGRDAMVELLLNAGADPNLGTPPPLMCATFSHELTIARRLLDAGADPDARYRGDTVAMWAAQHVDQNARNREFFQQLIALPEIRYCATAAIIAGDLEGATWLLEPPLHPDATQHCAARVHKSTGAARDEWLLLLRRLAEAGADTRPALRAARRLGDDALARAVIELGADEVG